MSHLPIIIRQHAQRHAPEFVLGHPFVLPVASLAPVPSTRRAGAGFPLFHTKSLRIGSPSARR